jgi:hypothetical protein
MGNEETAPIPRRQVPMRGSIPAVHPMGGDVAMVHEVRYDASEPEKEESSPSVEILTANQEQFLGFVNEQIERLRNHLLFEGGEPNFFQLNETLSKHENVLLGLTSLYEATRYEAKMYKEEFDEWYAIKYVDIRNRVNPTTLAATKYCSASEIGLMVRAENREKYAELMAKAADADHRLSTIKRLIDGWSGYQFTLGTISKNVQAEVSASLRHLD